MPAFDIEAEVTLRLRSSIEAENQEAAIDAALKEARAHGDETNTYVRVYAVLNSK